MSPARILLPFVLPALLLVSCKKEKPIITFEVVDAWSESVYLAAPPLAVYLPTRAVLSTGDLACNLNGTTVDQLQSASLSSVEMTVPLGQNFNGLQQIKLYLVTEKGDQFVVASQNIIPQEANKIMLTPTEASMLPYVRNRSYFIKPYLTLADSGRITAQVKTQFKFQVQAHKL